MKVKYHESQDIDLTLEKGGFEKLISNISEDLFENCLKASNLEYGFYFYLGHCRSDVFELIAYANKLDGGVQIALPELEGDPYYVNLPPGSEAIEILRKTNFYSARYPGGAKLKIKIENEQHNRNVD